MRRPVRTLHLRPGPCTDLVSSTHAPLAPAPSPAPVLRVTPTSSGPRPAGLGGAARAPLTMGTGDEGGGLLRSRPAPSSTPPTGPSTTPAEGDAAAGSSAPPSAPSSPPGPSPPPSPPRSPRLSAPPSPPGPGPEGEASTSEQAAEIYPTPGDDAGGQRPVRPAPPSILASQPTTGIFNLDKLQEAAGPLPKDAAGKYAIDDEGAPAKKETTADKASVRRCAVWHARVGPCAPPCALLPARHSHSRPSAPTPAPLPRPQLALGWVLVVGLFAALAAVSLVLGIGFSPEVTSLALAAWGVSARGGPYAALERTPRAPVRPRAASPRTHARPSTRPSRARRSPRPRRSFSSSHL